VPLKRSPEFRKLRSRLAGAAPHPVYDSWLDDGFHFFVFVLAPRDDGDGVISDENGVAVFAMHPEKPDPVSAVTVIPSRNGVEAEVANLREPYGSYTVQLRREPDS
jgi:hypothetical protein